MRSTHTLLTRLIDYAGLFPPAALPMAEAITNYANYTSSRDSWDSWMLGRFITPVARLGEFESQFEAATQTHALDDNKTSLWKLSVLSGADIISDLSAINEFNRRHALIDTIEIKAESIEEIERAMLSLKSTLTVYVEIPIANDPHTLVEVIARTGARAKVRTGGLTPEAIPSSVNLARFIAACASANVAFKATAGLHHPIRAVHRLTYEPDSPTGLMHGFLNVFLAAAWIYTGLPMNQVIELLDETSPAAFKFDDDGVTWREYRLTNDQLARAREDFAIAFGSCSFEEPVADLYSLGLLR